MKALLYFTVLSALLMSCDPKPQAAAADTTASPTAASFKALVFSKTAGYHHESIAAGNVAMVGLGQQHGFEVDTTIDAAVFNDEKLARYKVVIFLNTTLDVLDSAQQVAFEKYFRAGGGYVGIHAAADTEYDWPWYGKMVGGYFKSHPAIQEAVIHVADASHPSTKMLPKEWKVTDEWYNFKDLNPDTHVLCSLDESSYEGGENGENHPISWYHDFDGGRAWYTGRGHRIETFSEPLYLQHVWGGIQYAAGVGGE